LHIIVPSGRYDATRKQWHKVDQDYLFNVFTLAKVWRARMLEAINQSDVMTMPDNVPKKWVVDCRKVGFGLPAFKYLSRYLYRGVLPDSDIVNITESNVTFRYKQGGNNEIKTRTLPTLSFLWLILQHVLPKGLQRVRDYGFLRGNAKKLRLQILLKLDIQQAAQSLIAVVKKPVVYLCPCCQHAMKMTGTSRLI
jgi:hypothetical protein